MKKLLLTLCLLILFVNSVLAKSGTNINKNFDSVISNSGIEKSSVAISFKDLNTGKVSYQLNEKILMHPASVQKILTIVPAIEVLGNDYEFSTKLYNRDDLSYIIKLGADPYLSSKDLSKLMKNLVPETKNVAIDNSILEEKSWGEGWQWDDDMNVLMPKFNSYNLDNNLMKISVIPTTKGNLATIINPSKYPLVIINNVTTGEKNSISVKRDNSISANTISLSGTVNKPYIATIPTNNLKRYFNIKLTNILGDKNIYLKDNFSYTTVSENDTEIDKITHPISTAINDILKNSNNKVSETVNKLAGAKMSNTTGTDINGIEVFNQYCKKNKLDNSRIKLSDASGVSKNNLVNADFISEFLVLNKNNEILNQMATPGEGTLTHRMLLLKNNLRAKTGTLSDISSIAGYLTTKSNHKYAFCIIINDPQYTSYDMKTLEDYILREAYFKL